MGIGLVLGCVAGRPDHRFVHPPRALQSTTPEGTPAVRRTAVDHLAGRRRVLPAGLADHRHHSPGGAGSPVQRGAEHLELHPQPVHAGIALLLPSYSHFDAVDDRKRQSQLLHQRGDGLPGAGRPHHRRPGRLRRADPQAVARIRPAEDVRDHDRPGHRQCPAAARAPVLPVPDRRRAQPPTRRPGGDRGGGEPGRQRSPPPTGWVRSDRRSARSPSSSYSTSTVLPIMVCRYLGIPVGQYVRLALVPVVPVAWPPERWRSPSSTSTRRTPDWPPSWRRSSRVRWPGRCSPWSWRSSSPSSGRRSGNACSDSGAAGPDRRSAGARWLPC